MSKIHHIIKYCYKVQFHTHVILVMSSQCNTLYSWSFQLCSLMNGTITTNMNSHHLIKPWVFVLTKTCKCDKNILSVSLSLISFAIIALKYSNQHAQLRHVQLAIDIKFLYWYHDSKFHIDILIYRYISPIPNSR